MKNHRTFIFILVILLTFGLAACTRSASQPSTSGDESALPLPTMGTQDPMILLEDMATQTAIAQEAGAKAVEVETGEGEAEGEGATEGETTEGAGTEGEAAAEGSDEAASEETTGEADEEVGGGQEPVAEAKEYEVPDSYTIKSGEFPYCIARRFNIDPADLLNANGLGVNSQVYPGTTLTIPKNAGKFNQGDRALKSHPTDYTVVSGDTIYSIACLFGDVDPRAIEDVNDLGSGNSLSAGQVIKIP